MPAGRVQKSHSPRDVPVLGDPDRKRQLNVLAQRRYRQRRREKIAALEAQAKSLESLVDQHPTSSDEPSLQASPASEDAICTQDVFAGPYQEEIPGFAIHGRAFNTEVMEDLIKDFPMLPTPLPSSSDFTSFQSSSPSPSLNFPLCADGGVLTFPVLSMIQAFMSIANALDLCNENLWNPNYKHVMSATASYPVTLPVNLRPIPIQLVVPHHPALDLLPWPTMREKLILMLSLPSKMRPTIAQEDDDDGLNTVGMWSFLQPSDSAVAGQSKAITQLIQDLDDFQDGGGIIVHGNSVAWGHGNEFVEEAWEVGESFYRRWWFCLDQRIINQTNKRRKERGLGRLRLTS